MTPSMSFEVFPPRKNLSAFQEGVLSFAETGNTVSLTYGAGGSGRDRSETALSALLKNGLARGIMPHITASGHRAASMHALAETWYQAGIRKVLALRGDAAQCDGDLDLPCSLAVIKAFKNVADFDVSVACYPEGHPKSPSPSAEMDHLKRKFDAGASQAISQFFFDPDVFLRYRDQCHAAGVTGALVPGILLIADSTSLKKFAATCGATVPEWVTARFDGLEDDPETARILSIATCISLAERLISEGVSHLHLYTLNRFKESLTIANALGACTAPEVPFKRTPEEEAA